MDLIVTHSNTDFDGLAAQLAAQKLYPHALPVLNARLRDNVAEFEALYREELPFVAEEDLPNDTVRRLIVVDTPTAPTLPGLENERIPTLIFDHHPRTQAALPHEDLIHADVGATTSLLVERLRAGNVSLSVVEATLLLLGIYEDTGSLSYSTTRQLDVAAAAWLLGQSARIEAVQEFLQRPLTAVQERVFARLEHGLRIVHVGDAAVLLASAQVPSDAPQLAPLADKLRDLYAPAVIALAIGTGTIGTQIILRADRDALDVAAVARDFGGGGHAAAAAAYVREQAAPAVLHALEAAIRRHMHPSVSAATIMARHGLTITLDARVADMDAVFAQTDADVLPVVDDHRCVHGVLKRATLAHALRYQLGDAPIARYLWPDVTLVAPETPLAALRQRMTAPEATETRLLLVVDQQQRLLGTITAGDLLRAMGPALPHGATDLGARLDRFLDPALRELLQQAAALAEARGVSMAIVGGAVRDMLLGRPQGDLDLVVEGDATGLASALAAATGATMRDHAAFGTATLELPGRAPSQSHASTTIDLVMARSEYYEQPAALPQVQTAALRDDAYRRDFTVNTLAIDLHPARYGQLYDFCGGRHDLEQRVIRVLHSLSFLDDPTRMLRAARFAARLGFSIAPHTRALIDDALAQDMLTRITPQRVVNELKLLLGEPQPEQALVLMDELGLLRALHPALAWTTAQSQHMAAVRAAAFRDADSDHVALGLVVYPLDDQARDQIVARFRPPTAIATLMRDLGGIERLRGALTDQHVPASVLDLALQPFSTAALRTAQIAEGGAVAQAIVQYLTELRPARTLLDGDDLVRMGVKPGPIFKKLLAGLRAAKLDGLLATRDDETAWIQRMNDVL